MLNAEFEGIKEMYNTNSIRVPKPTCVGTGDYSSYVVFERLSIGGFGDPADAGRKLAKMHKNVEQKNLFGWKINNTIGIAPRLITIKSLKLLFLKTSGATHQPNNWCDSWVDFWDEYRLGHMLKLCKADGFSISYEKDLRLKVRDILGAHSCVPSCVHGIKLLHLNPN